ncbi:iron permease [Rhodoferax koreense]|uniref:High-potential iron-sulfur protein n=2 Tax=Rhodoferax koreensis TaxID=1842727 RepID=A0A1P8K3I5_9BURK|nr:high-potential iron-sulfur protein [Rhodoferax koreense]APW40573.1 iron permease [Rhodoferax koreense]
MNRRHIILQTAGAVALALGGHHAASAAGVKLEESDPTAVSLGYREDTRKVDDKKYPKHAASQNCGGCQLFQGTPQAATAGCPLFAGKQVANGGWCSAWVKKA